ncbi:MAG: hypothetical protein ACC656_14495 [Candidatus Heimdallarchaeota archaeon]
MKQNKKNINITVFYKQSKTPIGIDLEILKHIKLGDIIRSGYQEEHFSSDSQSEAYYFFKIIRSRLETEDELKKRIAELKKYQTEYKEKRYQTYLKLKKEFEDEKSEN